MSGIDELAPQIDATRKMLAVHKQRHAQKLALGDDEAAVAELDAITRLEVKLANLEEFLRLREMTRRA